MWTSLGFWDVFGRRGRYIPSIPVVILVWAMCVEIESVDLLFSSSKQKKGEKIQRSGLLSSRL